MPKGIEGVIKQSSQSQVLDILSSTGTLNNRVLSHWNKGQVHNQTRLEFSKAQVRVTIELKFIFIREIYIFE